MFFGKTAHAQQPSAQPAKAPAQGEQNVEVLLNTMNEVLEENRRIREELSSNGDALKKMATENNALRSQLRKMKRQEETSTGADKNKIKDLQASIAQLETNMSKLSEENTKLQELKSYQENKIPELEKETTQLRTLLDSAILEGERTEYLNLIQNAQDMASRSFEELSVSKSHMLKLEDETANAQYKLGNMLYDMKDFKNAIISYEKALEARPNDAWVHHNLGVIYDYYIHDDLKALYHYKQYLQFKPYQEEANAIRERILDMELKKNMVPGNPLKEDFRDEYTKVPR
jgi:tetratricopeptide (TPR) repeat protein